MTYEDDRQFQQVVMEGLVPKVENSAYCVSICPADDENRVDAKFCVELGVMIMLDKPIVAVIAPGQTLPKKLDLVADKVVHADITTEAGRTLLAEALRDLHEEFG